MHFFKEGTVSISLILVPDANRPCPMFPAACSVAVPDADAATASIPGRLGVTSRQRLPCFQEWVANLYMHSVRVRSLPLPRILALLGCRVGIAMLWRDVEAVGPSRVPTRRRPCRGGRSGRDLAVHRRRPPLGGRGSGTEGCTAGPAAERSRPAGALAVGGTGRGVFRARFKPWAGLTRGLKTEAGALNFVRLMGQGMV